MSGRVMDGWRWLHLVLLASVWTPACQESDDQARCDPAGEARYYRASFHGGAPDDTEPSLCETVCADLAPAGTPETSRTTPNSVIDVEGRPVDDVVRARAQPVGEHHTGPRAVDFGLAYDVVPVGWTGVSATD